MRYRLSRGVINGIPAHVYMRGTKNGKAAENMSATFFIRMRIKLLFEKADTRDIFEMSILSPQEGFAVSCGGENYSVGKRYSMLVSEPCCHKCKTGIERNHIPAHHERIYLERRPLPFLHDDFLVNLCNANSWNNKMRAVQ